MEVRGPKPLEHPTGGQLITWAQGQLEIADQIVDNPGGGLLFATQTMGQVRAALHEQDLERWEDLVALLDRAENAAVRRNFQECRRLLAEARQKLG
ncbi:MAG TPA: hypothetical protein VK131_09505 [Candidatus Acidoferrales bacterium]|nr:hypothetical protein [Candidatus Acidoferrales bacterium]